MIYKQKSKLKKPQIIDA